MTRKKTKKTSSKKVKKNFTGMKKIKKKVNYKKSRVLYDDLLLKPSQFRPTFINWKIDGVLNPAAIRLPNKKILLYVRVSESSPQHLKQKTCPIINSRKGYRRMSIRKMRIKGARFRNKNLTSDVYNVLHFDEGECILLNMSHFRRVLLDETGTRLEKIEQVPIFTGNSNEGQYGVEDPRITKIGRKYYMTYVTVSATDGISTSIAVSRNMRKWRRLGLVFSEQNKDVVLFPEKIKGKYIALHRPENRFGPLKPNIWISYSNDLVYWGKEKSIIQTRKRAWDCERIGAGPPPIKTDKGWLLIYHGVSCVQDRNIYCAGAILLDLKNPEKILARSPVNKPLIKPIQTYEQRGFINNVVFPTGIIRDLEDDDKILLYNGGADRYVSVKKMSIKDILNSLEYY